MEASAPGAVAINGDAPHAVIKPTIILPAPPAPPTARQQLPGDLPEFTGRVEELAALTTALDRDGGGTMVITAVQGMGGVGKTTLAQHAARRLTGRYPDGQIVVDLNGHGVGAPTAPLDAMMQVIRAFHPATPALTDLAQARAIYRDTLTGKAALILLDNAADTDQVRDLIPPPDCAALITARTLVKPPGCPKPLVLGLLPPDDSVALLRTLAPDATGTDDQWTRLAELCDHLPLALHLAGSTLAIDDDLALPDYLAELADTATRPHRLSLDGDTSSNVAAVLSHSLHRLTNQDPTLAARWQSLSVVAADFDCAMAAALWDMTETEAAPVLRTLRNRSLLLHDKATHRYRLHDLMRPLARSLFQTNPSQDPEPGTTARIATAEDRFAQRCMTVLAEADDLYLGGQDGVAAGVARYDADARNIAATAAWAIAHADHDPTAQQVAAWLPNTGVYVLGLQLHLRDKIIWLTAAAAVALRMGNPGLAACHLGNLGNAHATLGETHRAIDCHQQALTIAREIGDWRGEGNSIGNLGSCYATLGKTHYAIDFCEQALSFARKIGDRRGEGIHLSVLGNCYAKLGETLRAIDFHQQALTIAREIGDRRSEGNSLDDLGSRHAELNDIPRAIEFHEQALAIAREIGDRRGIGSYLGNLGNAYATLGETRCAIDFYQQALDIAREVDDRHNEGILLHNLADKHTKLGDITTAITQAEQALAIFVAIESPHAEIARRQLARLRRITADGRGTARRIRILRRLIPSPRRGEG